MLRKSFVLVYGIAIVAAKVQFVVGWSEHQRLQHHWQFPGNKYCWVWIWMSDWREFLLESLCFVQVEEKSWLASQGTCPTSSVTPPLTSLGGGDGAGQMQHFVKDDQMNIFRLRGWKSILTHHYKLIYCSRLLAIFSQQQARRHPG